MSNRIISCPDCRGAGSRTPELRGAVPSTFNRCPQCKGVGTIPDRRKPTANDRAVDRIRVECIEFVAFAPSDALGIGMVKASRCMLHIINEEAADD